MKLLLFELYRRFFYKKRIKPNQIWVMDDIDPFSEKNEVVILEIKKGYVLYKRPYLSKNNPFKNDSMELNVFLMIYKPKWELIGGINGSIIQLNIKKY